MDAMAPYDTRVAGNTIVVTVGQSRGATAAAGSAANVAAAPSATDSSGAPRRGNAQDRCHRFPSGRRRHRPVDGRAERLAHAGQRPPGRPAGGGRFRRRQDGAGPRRASVTTSSISATPVQYVDALRVDGSSRLVVNAQGDFEQLAYQTDNQYVIEVRATTPSKGKVADEKKDYTGERLDPGTSRTSTSARCCSCWPTPAARTSWSATRCRAASRCACRTCRGTRRSTSLMRTKGLSAMRRRDERDPGRHPAEELATREKAEPAGAQGSRGTGAAADREVPAGQLRQGLGPGRADQGQERQFADLCPR